MDDRQIVSPDFELWALLAQTQHMIFRVRAGELKQYGISVMEFGVLLIIIHIVGNDATPGTIAQWLGRTPQSTSSLLSRMEKGGLVKKIKDLDRKTSVRIVVTERGQQIYDQAKKADSIHRMMSSLSQARRQRLGEDLETLRKSALKELTVMWRPLFPKAPIRNTV